MDGQRKRRYVDPSSASYGDIGAEFNRVRVYRRYQLPITQVIVLLKATSTTLPEVFQVEGTQHHYQILRMWEQNPAPFLENTALLPLASLCAAENSTQLLSRVAEQVSRIETPSQRQEISTCTQFLAGLRFNIVGKEAIAHLLFIRY